MRKIEADDNNTCAYLGLTKSERNEAETREPKEMNERRKQK